jgi:hypothetical protein
VTPDLEAVIAGVLAGHLADQTTGHYRKGGRWEVLCSCGHVSKYKGDPDFDDTEHAAHQAAAVLAALKEAGRVEWAVATRHAVTTPVTVPEASARSMATLPGRELISRVVWPWEAVTE